MSVKYTPVQWNKIKWQYNAVMLASVALFLSLFIFLSPDVLDHERPINGQIHNARAFGACAFMMLTVILCIGPLARLDARFLPLLYNRRHFGVMTAFVALTHAGYILNWYFAFLAGSKEENLLMANTSFYQLAGFPFEVFGIIALLCLGVLATTSHDFWQRVEAVIPADCIFASNTSTLPISDLAKASSRPEQFIGIHFFSPVEKMLLVEIIKGAQTGDVAVAKSLDYVRQIRKTPIVVNDARFFYANRCIIPYGNEASRMVTEGIAPQLIDSAAQQLGFPVGRIQLGDETSIDLNVRIMKATKAAMGNAYPASEADDLIVWV